MSTQSVLATSPTMSSFNGCTTGVTRQFAIASRVTLAPGASGHASSQIGNMRSRSALRLGRRDAGLEPRERVIPSKPPMAELRRVEPHGDDDVELRRHVEEAEIARHDADDFAPAAPSIESSRPSAASSPPNRRCQNAYERIDRVGAFGGGRRARLP